MPSIKPRFWTRRGAVGRTSLFGLDKPSALGSWSYEVVETKLARSTKATALVQLCFYSDLLARIQGVEPQWMHVVLGGAASSRTIPSSTLHRLFPQGEK